MSKLEQEQEQEISWTSDCKELAPILDSLPLNRCERHQNLPAGEWGWFAPPGWSFKITGQFTVNIDSSHPYECCPPDSSGELLRAEFPDLYRQFLRESHGKKRTAMNKLLEELDDRGWGIVYRYAPESFIGKWLIVEPDFNKPFSSYTEDDNVHVDPPAIYIKSLVDAWYDRSYLAFVKNVTPDSVKPIPCTYESPYGEVIWEQRFATAVLGHCQVVFVEWPEQEQEFYIPEAFDNAKIELPLEARPGLTAREYAKALLGINNLTDQQEHALMRNKWREGIPFSDDPLRDIILPEHDRTRRIIVPKQKRPKGLIIPKTK